MKINIELNGVNVSREIPLNWSQVTFDQFLTLSEVTDLAGRISVFTGVEAETLRKVKINNLETIVGLLSFIDKETLDMSTIPKEIAGFKMPQNLGTETIAQFEDLKLEASKMKDNGRESMMAYPKFCAIYATNPYDWGEAEKKIELFLKAPCTEVLAIGNFTLAKLIESSDPSLKEALKPHSPIRRLKQAIQSWLRVSVFTARYYSWKRKLRIKGTSY